MREREYLRDSRRVSHFPGRTSYKNAQVVKKKEKVRHISSKNINQLRFYTSCSARPHPYAMNMDEASASVKAVGCFGEIIRGKEPAGAGAGQCHSTLRLTGMT